MENNENKVSHSFTLDSFTKAKEAMIATNTNTYKNTGYSSYWEKRDKLRDYTTEEVHSIINSGSSNEQQKLSRSYFHKGGYYTQIVLHYATLLTYAGLLIPNPSAGKNLSTSHIQKRYYNAMDYVERMQLPSFLTNCAVRALTDGCYYGLITELDKSVFTTIDLPAEYCRSNFKDVQGNDVIEFDLSYFDTITDKEVKKGALAAYPKVFSKAYKDWEKRRRGQWFIIPSEIAICFPILSGRPPFLSVIPASIDYDESVITERERDLEEIRKIVVQKIPHLTDGRLLFEPDEALEIHTGTVGMLKGNKNISVMTTYADVDAIASKTQTDNTTGTLEKMEKNIYAQAGVSSEVFTSSGSSSLDASLRNDMAFMMLLANKFSAYITNLLNRKFSNSNVSFKYTILPITYHNYDKFADTSFKLVGSGYSFLMPALAVGLSQKDLGNLKDLENDVLKLGEKLIPPSTSYTQSADGADDKEDNGGEKVETDIDEGGRPAKEDSEKADTTLKKDKSLDKNGGGS
jgi:hypothetical protein